MSEKRHLRLVPYNPSDYSLGEVLVKDNQTLVTDDSTIGSALSLLFQWPDHVMSFLISESGIPLQIKIDYDREERSISELWIKFIKNISDIPPVASVIRVRFEVFRQCYEFESQVIATEAGLEGNWNIILSPPTQLLAYKQRRLPRVLVTDLERHNLPECRLIYADDSVSIVPIQIDEMGLGSMRLTLFDDHSLGIKSLKVGAVELPLNLVRRDGNKAVVTIKMENCIQFGAMFDIYRLVAFPNLCPREQMSQESLLKLYSETKYFEKFETTSQLVERTDEIKKLWTDLRGEQHNNTADYVTISEDGTLTGASSASLSFQKNGKQVWAFHQLCARQLPTLLEHSSQLYTWRAEYLAARPEALEVVVWFHSISRWLERIYVKFAFQKNGGSGLHAVDVYRKTVFQKKAMIEPVGIVNKVTFGKRNRHIVCDENILAAVNPSFLNASSILDSIVCLNSDVDLKKLENVENTLCGFLDGERQTIEITYPIERQCDSFVEGAEKIMDVDRFIVIDKEELVDFLASVEHSVAVTSRKMNCGDLNAAG